MNNFGVKRTNVQFCIANLWRALNIALNTCTIDFSEELMTTPRFHARQRGEPTCVIGYIQIWRCTWSKLKIFTFSRDKLHAPAIGPDVGFLKILLNKTYVLRTEDQFNVVRK